MTRDHPRIRGEKSTFTANATQLKGSPPHTRGKEHNDPLATALMRITPAYAGKSVVAFDIAEGSEDHPRIRGEKSAVQILFLPVQGSPPHTRGKALSAWSRTPFYRITPAYAGKSLAVPGLACPARDHPRIRGEKNHPFHPSSVTSGSPPHTRGKGDIYDQRNREPGITPAYAGKRFHTQNRRC